MRHSATSRFWTSYEALPTELRALADKNFELLRLDHHHPSLKFKQVGKFWSARVGIHHRALALEVDHGFLQIWIGSHADYEKLIRQPPQPRCSAAESRAVDATIPLRSDMHIDIAWHKHYAHALSGYASVHGVNTKDHMVRDIIFYLRHREPKLCYPEGDYRNVFTKEDAWLLRYRVGQRAYLNLKRGVIGAAGMVVVLAAIVVFFEGISSLQQKQHMRDCIATKIAGSGLHTDTAVERYQHACIREFETRAELESG